MPYLRLPSSLLRFFACAPLLVLVACQSGKQSATAIVHPDGRVLDTTVEPPSTDHEVEQHLAQYIRGTQIVDGLQRIQLDLKNNSSASLAFAYQVEWLDRAGEVVEEREALWTPLLLRGGEQVPLELQAPDPRAKSWRLRAVSLPPSD